MFSERTYKTIAVVISGLIIALAILIACKAYADESPEQIHNKVVHMLQDKHEQDCQGYEREIYYECSDTTVVCSKIPNLTVMFECRSSVEEDCDQIETVYSQKCLSK